MRVIAIHGFLGLPSDWDLVFTGVSGLEIEHVNLWNDLKTLGSSASFRTWAELFIERTGKNPERPMLVGYSLGGRLAMQAITMAPHAFSSAVIVSANPGLKNVDEKRDRLAADFKWAERFSKEPWSELMTAWNSQNVFAAPATSAKDRILLERSEADFDRGFLAQSLDVWSLARQADLSIPLRSFAKPLKMV
ncbi:MAG: alpha/beta fold hydrolase, partial [Bdellovibrionota bacterium]